MNRLDKAFLFSLFLMSTASHSRHACDAVPYIPIRSQAVNLARRTVGYTNEMIFECSDLCEYAHLVSGTFQGTRSFDSEALAQCLFGGSVVHIGDYPAIRISGSRVATRENRDWLADYFGLPSDYVSVIQVRPRVSNMLFDIDWIWYLDPLCEGMYFRANAPIVHTRFDLNASERKVSGGAQGYQAGYFSADTIPADVLAPSALSFLSGNFSQGSFGLEALRYSKWNSCNGCTTESLKKTGLAELHLIWGYTIASRQSFHLSLEARYHAPTGTTPNGCYFFEPIVGNGHHNELGVGWNSHITLWRDCCDEYRSVNIWCVGFVTHLFTTRQDRVFDLCNGPSSRYMLASKIEPPVNDGLKGSPSLLQLDFTDAQAQFKGQYTPVANLTRLSVDVSAKIQADVVALFNYTDRNFSWDLGYEFWLRSCEDISNPRCITKCAPEGAWAVKGDSQMYGQTVPASGSEIIVALSASQADGATIFAGTNRPCSQSSNEVTFLQNANIDNAQFAFADVPVANTLLQPIPAAGPPISTSIQPQIISLDSINIQAMRSKGISNKIFTHLSYTWHMRCVTPFIGFGGSGEFGSRQDCIPLNECAVNMAGCNECCSELPTTPIKPACIESSCNTSECCNRCKNCSLSQWAIWIKGGVFFDT